MATIGVSKPMYALYSNNGTAVTYSNGGVLGKMTDVDVSINTSEGNNLYADNGIAEMDRSFSDGTLTVGTDDLSQEVSKAILGVTEQPVGTIDGINPTEGSSYTELIFDDDMETPYLGVGFIIKKQKNTVTPNLALLSWASGNRKPKGMVMITFKNTCLEKSPLPKETSINGTKFMGL